MIGKTVKTITYSTFLLVSFLTLLAFVRAKTYTELAVAIVLYPALAYFALRLFPRKTWNKPVLSIKVPIEPVQKTELERVDIADIDKRAFLKLIGVAGFYFFISSFFSRRGESLFFDKATNSGVTALEDPKGNKIYPAERHPTDGYEISEIDDSDTTFFGYTNTNGHWYIMKGDAETGSFRYTKGENDFHGNWTNRENLKYIYFHELFTTG